AHRGFKALLAGLSFIHDEEDQRGFVGFNLMALFVLIAAFGLLFFMSGIFLTLRLLGTALDLRPLAGVSWIQSEWTWASFGIVVGMTLVYRYAMPTVADSLAQPISTDGMPRDQFVRVPRRFRVNEYVGAYNERIPLPFDNVLSLEAVAAYRNIVLKPSFVED
ncbi:MAG: YhjD/YihY/BrkB family envelope integrity protein, partial [Rickettsiales bacterium]